METLVILIVVSLYIGGIVLVSIRDKLKTDRKTLTPEQAFFLHRNLPFYDTLDEQGKKRFNHRMALFLEFHQFYGRDGLVITEEMKITIAGAGIHLTFGMDDFMFYSFLDIYVYPAAYYSPFSKTMNKGETNPQGIIAFSWPHLEEGFETTSDKINLGYHEFAHALLLQQSQEELNDSTFGDGYRLFSIAMQKYKIARQAYQLDFLREYAFTNKMEFFAVCTEHFMEAPEDLNNKFPGLYLIMTRMLRIDPLNRGTHLSFDYDDETVNETIEKILDRDGPY